MHGPAHRHAFVKPPRAARRPNLATWHGVELVDEYAWLRADNWQEVMRDPARARPRRSAPTWRPRTPTREAHAAPTRAALQDDAVRRDEGAHQGGRQLGAGARRRLRVLHQLCHRRPVSARVPASARRRARDRSCSTATRRPRASLLAARRHRRTAPTTSSWPTPSTTRAPSSSPSASAIWRPGEDLRRRHPRHAQRRRLGPRQPDPVLCPPRRQPAPALRLPPPRRHPGQRRRARLRGEGQRLLRRRRPDPVGQVHHHRRARPPDQRGLPDRRRSRRESAAAAGGAARSTATSTASSTMASG